MKLSSLLLTTISIVTVSLSNLSTASAGAYRRPAPRPVARQAGHAPIHCSAEQWLGGVFYCQNPTISYFGSDYIITGFSKGCSLIGMRDWSDEHTRLTTTWGHSEQAAANIENGIVSLTNDYDFIQTMMRCVPCD